MGDKPTHTNRYIPFHSHHHPRMVTGVLRCMRDRANRICDSTSKTTELQLLQEVFQANGFPEGLVRKTLSQKPSLPPVESPSPPDVEPPKILRLPYVRGVSEVIERVCAPLGLKAAFKPMRTLRQCLMRVKTTTPQDRRKGVVYEVPCKECDKRYIGETKRTLKVRLGEHKQAVKRGDPKNGIAVHTHVSNHTIDWDEAKVRISVSGYWQRRATEAIFIKKSGETMNLDSGLQLPTMWNPILDPP